jgi:hypothetical protein
MITSSRVLTPGEQCVAHVLLKIDGGAVVIDHATLSCN